MLEDFQFIMPQVSQSTTNQIRGLHLLRGFYDALEHDQLHEFLRTNELERFLHEIASGPFGGQIPDGEPGSEFPGLGLSNPLDILHDLFNEAGGDLGIVDNPGSSDGLSFNTGDDKPTRVITHDAETGVATVTEHNPETHTTTITQTFRDKHVETYTEVGGREPSVTRTNSADGSKITLTPDGHGGMNEDRSDAHSHTVRHVKASGMSDDERVDMNSGQNPLSGIAILGPQSMQQMINQMRHPDKDSDELDPNSGSGGIELTEEDRERLGRIVPRLDVLDPNSGIDPLTQLNIDPNQIHARSEEDDRMDPNTGQEPTPFGG
jgi:hypothetical protein